MHLLSSSPLEVLFMHAMVRIFPFKSSLTSMHACIACGALGCSSKGVNMYVKGRGILGLGLPTMMMMIRADGMEYDGMEYGENSLFVSKQAAHPPFFAPPLVIRPPYQGVGVGEDKQGRL